MPGFDGTGPRGQGPMTGGGQGYCAVRGNTFGSRLFGRGFYCGRGGGRGWRNWFHATDLPAYGDFNRTVAAGEELSRLKDQAVYLKEEIDVIQSRIQDLEGKQEAGK